MKKISINKILLLLTGLLLVGGCYACGSSEDEDEGSATRHKGKLYRKIEKNIHTMVEKPWDKATYLEIKDKQIPMLEKKSQVTSASALLEAEYSKLMVRDAKNILESGCQNGATAHNTLNQLMTELKAYPKVPGLKEVQNMKASHDAAFNFINSAVGRQAVSSYRTPYDKSYESKQIAEAKKRLSDPSLKCSVARNKLQALTSPSAYTSRRNAYCQSVLSLYLKCTDPAKPELTAAKKSIYDCLGSSNNTYISKMQEHWNNLNTSTPVAN